MKLKSDTKVNNTISSETGDDRLHLKYQDKEYNESYKRWRLKNKDSLGFFFAENPNRLTYQDNVGFINDYPEVQEEKTMRRVIAVLGIVLIFRSFFDIFSAYILPNLLQDLGMNIHYDFFTGKLYGDDTLVLTVKFISEMLSMLLSIGILIRLIRMPFRIMLPLKVTNTPMFRASVPVMLLVCGVCSIMSTVYEQILSLAKISTERSMLFPESVPDFIYMVITQILIIPAVSELCSRGVILQFTRQFGDGAALLITSFITAALYRDITQFCFAFIAAVSIGYFTIRTGSVITAVIMRITMNLYVYILYFLDYKLDSDMLVMLFIFSNIIIGIIFTIYFLYNHSDCFGMKLSSRYMSFGKKMLAFFTSTPIIIWLTTVFIVTIFNINFNFIE